MDALQQYVQELAKTRVFSDFTFKVEGGEEHRVHKVVLAAQSRVFEKFFQRHEREASLFDLFVFNTSGTPSTLDEYSKIAIRETMIDDFGYCYFGDYNTGERENSDDFTVSVLRHLLVYGSAVELEISGLLVLSTCKYISAFVSYNERRTTEQRVEVLKRCFLPDLGAGFGCAAATTLVQNTAINMFGMMVAECKKNGQFKEALDLMEAVPMAAAELYNQPSTENESAPEEEESEQDLTENADEESTENDEDEQVAKDGHVTG